MNYLNNIVGLTLTGSGELAVDISEGDGESVKLGVLGPLPSSTHGASNDGIFQYLQSNEV